MLGRCSGNVVARNPWRYYNVQHYDAVAMRDVAAMAMLQLVL